MKEKELQLSSTKAVEAYKLATADQKQLLENMYGRENFLTDIRDRVFDYPSACNEAGVSELTIEDFDFLPKEEQERAFMRHQLAFSARLLRSDWVPDPKDGKAKYYVYSYWNNSEKCFDSYVSDDYVYYSVGSDLLFPNQELAEHHRVKFEQQYIKCKF